MADQQGNANSSGTNQNQSGGASPWDEPVDFPEEKKKEDHKPQIIGSLDSEEAKEEEKPVPFNIPEEVVEEKVAKTIPAEEIMGRDKPPFSLAVDADRKTVPKGTSTLAPKEERSAEKTSLPSRDLPDKYFHDQPKVETPKVTSAAVLSDTAVPQIPLANQKSDKVLPLNKTEPVVEKETVTNTTFNVPSEKELEMSNPVVSGTLGVDKSEGISALILPKASDVASGPTVNNQTPERVVESSVQKDLEQNEMSPSDASKGKGTDQGISELLLGESEKDPFADPFAESPAIANKQEQRSQPVITESTNKDAVDHTQNSKKAFDISAPAPKQAVIPTSNYLGKNEPDPVGKADGQPLPEAVPDQKRSIFSRLNPFAKRASTKKSLLGSVGQGVTVPNINNSQPEQNISPIVPPLSPSVAQRTLNGIKPKRSFKLSTKFSVIFSVIFILVACVYLTEIGLISIGVEKIYGIVGLERIWGGLPKSSESALAMAVTRGQNNLNFKYRGTVSATVDKTKKSPVTLPLVAYSHLPQPLADVMIGSSQEAWLTQYDYYGDSTDTTTDTSGSASSSDSSSDTGSASDITSPTPTQTDTTDSASSTTDSNASYVPEESTIKQIELTVSGDSNDEAVSSDLVLKPLVGSDKYISLMSSAGNLYVKSDDIIFNDKSESGKWLDYSFSGFNSDNTYQNFLNLNPDQGFSLSGSRLANEKLSNGVRAYNYKIDSLEIADSLSGLGINKEMVESISGNVWVGIRDHLIHKVSLEIIPSVSAGFTKINCDLELYDYNINNDIVLPAFDNVIAIASEETEISTSLDTSASASSSSPDTTSSSSATSATTRTSVDSQRVTDLTSVKNALIAYKKRYGYYPRSSIFENISKTSSKLVASLVPNYISSLPSDPNSAENWWYGYKSDGKSFTLSARFENISDTEVTKVGSVYLHYVYGN